LKVQLTAESSSKSVGVGTIAKLGLLDPAQRGVSK
jgi:hypothetical protein